MSSAPLAATAAATTRENPWPLAMLTGKIKPYVDRMSALWVSGQVVEYRPRPGTRMAFFVIRDHHSEVSMTVKCFGSVLAPLGDAFEEGVSVVMYCKPDFYEGSGQLSLHAAEIHVAGVGALLIQIERLRRQLASEGLFSDQRKQPLPFLPRRIGLICGRNAKARHDVEVNAAARWPATAFEVREVKVQGPQCAGEVVEALTELDAIEDIDVIVIARGGGSVEDLLPFSDERLVRAVSAATTPVVSAIGHETDVPLLDLVADYRASTPTDAARRIVPDLAEESQMVAEGRQRMSAALTARLQREFDRLADVRARPVMASPAAMLAPHSEALRNLRAQLRSTIAARLDVARSELGGQQAALRALSPQAVLDRGYAIMRMPDRRVIRSVGALKKNDLIEFCLADGTGVAHIVGVRARDSAPAPDSDH